MKVTVKLFSGRLATRTVELPAGATVAQLLDTLRQDERAARSLVLVNHAKADEATSLADGDEVLMLPLLPGG